MQNSQIQALRKMPWWSSPAGINFGFLIPILLLIASMGDSSYSGLTVRGVRFLTPLYIGLGCGVLFVTGLCGWMGAQIQIVRRASVNGWDRGAVAVGLVALFAYCVWFRDFVFNPLLLFKTLTGAYHPDRTTIQLTTGVTSLANCAPAFFAIYAYRTIMMRDRIGRTLHVMCAILAAFTLFRVYAWSERLAMIEAIIPFALASFGVLMRSDTVVARLVARLGPLFGIPLLILYFAVFEYFRSWRYAVYNTKYNFWEFAVGRLVSYYYTSLNNGAGVLSTASWPTYKFENVLSWLHKAPVIGPYFSHVVGLESAQMEQYLFKFGDEEFNNPSGIYAVIYDLGLTGGLLYFSLVALLGGCTFRAYRTGHLLGVLFYPMYFITFLEVFRFPYLGMSRAFTWTLGSLLVVAFSGEALRAAYMPARSSAHSHNKDHAVRGGPHQS